MHATATTPRLTPEEFLSLPDRARFELVDGHLVEVNVSNLSSWVGGELFGRLREHCRAQQLGYVWPADLHVRCFDIPGKFRKPDVTFLGRGRSGPEVLDEGFLPIAPDLVVEVVSPGDLAYEVDLKVQEYLDAGVRLVWVVNPELRTVRVHRGDGSIGGLREADDLDGEDVVPGFRCRVGNLFPERPRPAE